MGPVIVIVALVLLVPHLIFLLWIQRQLSLRDRDIRNLTERLWRLETARADAPSAPVAEPMTAVVETPQAQVGDPPSLPHPIPERAAAVRRHPSPSDWESRIGANWLNRIGALLLVIGMASFFGYSLTRFGPAGKIGAGVATAAVLLGAGAVARRREAYRSYAVGLFAGGWALLYLAAYASYALPAARLTDDPSVATAAMLCVSAAMFVHAAFHRQEIITALASAFGFISLHVTTLSAFTVGAAVLLLGGALLASMRFRWSRLPVAAALLAYLTVVLRYTSTTDAGTQTAAAYVFWVLLEMYGIASAVRGPYAPGLPLINFTGLAGTLLVVGLRLDARDAATHLAIAGGLYAALTAVRFVLERRSARTPEFDNQFGAGWDASLFGSIALFALATVLRFTGPIVPAAWALGGEMLWLLGLRGKRPLARRGGELLLAVAFGRLLLFDFTEAGASGPASAVAAAMAIALSYNRRLVPSAWPFTVGAAALVLSVAGRELSRVQVGTAWCILGAAVALACRRFPAVRTDVRWASTLAALAGLGASITCVGDPSGSAMLLCSTAILFGMERLAAIDGPKRLLFAVAGSLGAGALAADRFDGGALTVALGIGAAVLVGAGFALSDGTLRICGLGAFVVCTAKLFLHDLQRLDAFGRMLAFLTLGVLFLAASWVYTRWKTTERSNRDPN